VTGIGLSTEISARLNAGAQGSMGAHDHRPPPADYLPADHPFQVVTLARLCHPATVGRRVRKRN
jgi:hypothetical protein